MRGLIFFGVRNDAHPDRDFDFGLWVGEEVDTNRVELEDLEIPIMLLDKSKERFRASVKFSEKTRPCLRSARKESKRSTRSRKRSRFDTGLAE